MRYKQIAAPLVEGIQYGEKEKQYVLSNLNKFNFGIEIELKMNGSNKNILKAIKIANKDFPTLMRHGVSTHHLEYDNLGKEVKLRDYIEEPYDEEASLKALQTIFDMWSESQLDDYSSIDDLYYFLASYASEEVAVELRDQVQDQTESFIKFLETFDIDYTREKIEYENLSTLEEVKDYIKSEGYGDSFKVEWENNGMAELISKTVSGDDISRTMKETKEVISLLKSKGMTDEKFSGMHMSISYQNRSRDMDFVKFIMLSDTYRQLIPKEHRREFVNDIREELSKASMMYLFNYDMSKPFKIQSFLQHFLYEGVSFEKYRSVNFGGFDIQKGRVELRWPGGKDYTERMDAYFDSVIRAMFALEISYNEEAYKKEFYQTVIREVNAQTLRSYGIKYFDLVEEIKKTFAYLKRKGHNVKLSDIPDLDTSDVEIVLSIDGDEEPFPIDDLFDSVKLNF